MLGTRVQPKHILWLLVLAFVVAAPWWMTNNYHRQIMVWVLTFGLVAISLELIMGHMGQFSFGHAAFWGLGAYASAKLTLSLGQSAWLGFLLAPAITGAAGFVLGYISLRRTRGPELAILTFGFGAILFLVISRMYSFSGGMTGLHNVPAPWLFKHQIWSQFSYFYFVLPIVLAALYFVHRFSQSKLGRAVKSIRENEELAKSIGISPHKYYTIAFTISCAMVGFAGALHAHNLHFVNPFLLHANYTIIFVMILLIGGVGTLWGPVVGAAIYQAMSEALRFNEELRLFIFGVILVFIVLFLPRGVVPTVLLVWNRYIAGRDWLGGFRRAIPIFRQPALQPRLEARGSDGLKGGSDDSA